MSENPEIMPDAAQAKKPAPHYRQLFNPNSNGPKSTVGRWETGDADAKTFAARLTYKEPKQLPLELETPKQPEWSGHLVPDSWFEAEKSRQLVHGDTPGGPNYRS